MKKINKKVILFLTAILFIVIFTSFFIPKDYSIEYKIDGYTVKESYNKNNKLYTYQIVDKKLEYNTQVKSKYIKGKKHIKSVTVYKDESSSCMVAKNKQMSLEPMCYENGKRVSFNIIENNKFEDIVLATPKYDNITLGNYNISSTLGKNIFIWNYSGYDYIKDNKIVKIKLFDKEIYNNPGSIVIDKYLVTPDYADNYNYSKLFIINMKNGKNTEIKLDIPISSNSYILGSYKKNIYIVDIKNKEEYKINIKNGKQESVLDKYNKGSILINGKWEKVSITKLVNNKYQFTKSSTVLYTVDKAIYKKYFKLNDKIMISKKIPDSLTEYGDSIYYISEGKLYYNSSLYGEIEMISYPEWNFNYNNMVYIY